MAVQIIVDSIADITGEDRDKLIILPVTIRFDDGNEYKDGETITHKEFYEKLIESDSLPTTSQVTPYEYEEVFEKIKQAGDEAVVITMSSKISGTYQSACLAAQDYEGVITVVDSLNATVGERALVDMALALRDEGKSAKEIADVINEERHNVQLVAVLDTLEYLKKGGRISSAVAFAGGVLAIKPVVGVVNGEVIMYGKARGSKNAGNALVTQINACGGIDFTKPYRVGYAGLSDHLLKKYIEDSSDMWAKYVDEIPYQTVGCGIGTHVGPGAAAAAFFPKHPERLKK
ncbi:MAG: DegV family protein [Lachnospiraceae bacterium]|nr:DegV family protein [Lachnospiraceae bacterium]